MRHFEFVVNTSCEILFEITCGSTSAVLATLFISSRHESSGFQYMEVCMNLSVSALCSASVFAVYTYLVALQHLLIIIVFSMFVECMPRLRVKACGTPSFSPRCDNCHVQRSGGCVSARSQQPRVALRMFLSQVTRSAASVIMIV
jgi:hypothetical protein